MSLKKMLALLVGGFVVVVVLGVYALVVEPARPTTEEAAKQRQLVFRYQDEQNRTLRDVATKIEIKRGGKTVVLEKVAPQVWRMRKPLDARADRSKILGILDTLKDLKTEAVVELESTKPEELDKFGLKTPRVEATVWLQNGQSHSFAIGAERKGQKTWEKRTYLRLKDASRLLVVDNDIAEKLDKDPDDFRDKHVFDAHRDPEHATALKVVRGQKTIELKKEKRTWRLLAPVQDRADNSKVASLLTKARNLEAEKFIADKKEKLADYGLDKPQLVCVVTDRDGKPMKLLVGAKAEDAEDQFYACRDEEPFIFTIKKDFLDDFDLKVEDVRNRKVADFDEDDIRKIEIARGDQVWTLTRKSASEDWKLVKPREAKAEDLDVDDFLKKIGRLRVQRWVDDPKDKAHELLAKPDFTITLARSEDDKEPIVLLASKLVETPAEAPKKKEEAKKAEKPKEKAKGEKETKEEKKPEPEKGRYLQRKGEKFLLYVRAGKAPEDASYDEKDSVEAINDIGKAIEKGYLAFLDRQVFDFDDDKVVRLTIERPDTKVVCEKKDGDWKLVSPAKLDADKDHIATILGAMDDLTADEYVVENPKDLKPYGLDKPALRLTATIEGSPKTEKTEGEKTEKKSEKKKTYTKTLLLSRKIDGKTYGMEQGGKLVFTLKSWDVTSLTTEPISTKLGDFATDDATALTIAHRGKPEIVLEKKDDTWKLTKPKKAEADQDAVKKVIDALHDLNARRCLDYEAKDLKPYGLDPAEVVVTVKLKDKADFVLNIGKPVPGETEEPGFYARKGEAKQVFLVAKGKVEDIAKSLDDLLKKKPEKKQEKKQEKPEKKTEAKAEKKDQKAKNASEKK